MHRSYEPGLGGVVSLEPQPFFHGCKAAPKSQWVTVKALWYRPSEWLEGLRRIQRRFEGKGAIGGMRPFPVASSPETTPPVQGSVAFWLRPKAFIRY
jgi:hypothetical protein